MKLKINTPLVIVGQVGRNKFKAEVHPQARVIVCSSEPSGGLLPNNDTEKRARFIARRLLLRRAPLSMFLRFWLYVEAQTCFGEVTLKRIGSKRQQGTVCTAYDDLTPEEASKVQPLIESLQDAVKSLSTNLRTPSPSATR
jgi:hypothetical protein